MKNVLLALSVLFITSCKGDHIEETQVGDFELQLLFEHEGCKMYRFLDGHWVYWSDCSGRTEYNTGGKHNVNVQSINN